MKKASVHILSLFATLNVFAQTPAHVDVWGMRPEAGQTISGHVYLDSIAWAKVQRAEKRSVIASGRKPEYGGDWIEGFVMDANGVPLRNAVVTEIDSNGKVVSETKTFKNGEFLLYQTNPDNHLKVSHDDYNDVITKADGVRLVTLMNIMK